MSTEKTQASPQQVQLSPMSVAQHYAKSAQFWENEAKRLQNTVDMQAEELRTLRADLEAALAGGDDSASSAADDEPAHDA